MLAGLLGQPGQQGGFLHNVAIHLEIFYMVDNLCLHQITYLLLDLNTTESSCK